MPSSNNNNSKKRRRKRRRKRMSLQTGQTSDPPLIMEEMHFWLDKAVAWDQRDTCLHLSKLKEFLQQLFTLISQAVSKGKNSSL